MDGAREYIRVGRELMARAEHGLALCLSVPESPDVYVETLAHGPPWARLVDTTGKPL